MNDQTHIDPRTRPTAAEEFSHRASPPLSTELRGAGREFLSLAIRLPSRLLFSGPVMSVLCFGAAFGIWHHFYPAAANRNGALVQNFVSETAETVTSWVGALKAG